MCDALQWLVRTTSLSVPDASIIKITLLPFYHTQFAPSAYKTSALSLPYTNINFEDAYVKTCGRKHPSLLGQSGAQGWAE